MNRALLVFVLIAPALAFVALLKLAAARAVWRWVWHSSDISLRRLVVFSALPAVWCAVWAGGYGLSAQGAVAMGLLLGLGVLILAAGALGLERLLIETDSDALVRRATKRPPTTTAKGRCIAALIGGLLVVGCGGMLWMLTAS